MHVGWRNKGMKVDKSREDPQTCQGPHEAHADGCHMTCLRSGQMSVHGVSLSLG